jgi:cytochrome c oxidase subunit 1
MSHESHPAPGNFLTKYVFSLDHKIIGIQFLFSGLIFWILGGLLALGVRLQLGWPNQALTELLKWFPFLEPYIPSNWGSRISPEFYTMLFTMHATVMIFFVVVPWLGGAFGNYLIPLMIGARDMAFPKLNMLSYWILWPSFVFLIASFFVDGGAPGSGWTAYPTLASVSQNPEIPDPGFDAAVKASAPADKGQLPAVEPGLWEKIKSRWNSPAAAQSGQGQVYWLISLIFSGISSMMGSINYITTILNCRAPGMTLLRMPLTVWGLFVTAILQALALPVLTVALFMQLLDRTVGTVFFLPPAGLSFGNWHTGTGGGQPLLWQHLFWFYSHPAVYIMILPAMGMVSDILVAACRKPLFGYKPMVFSMIGIAGLGFIVWGHHMFQSGMDPRLGTGFMVATILIALPSAVKTFNWLATVWGSRIHFTAASLNALAFVSMFIIGGLSGIYMASTPVDIYIHDTYFIVAHIHYVLFLSSMFGIYAGIYFWFPKMFGRTMNESVGKIHFVLTFLLANGTFFPMHILGIRGHPRRYYDPSIFDWLSPVQPLNQFISICAILMGLVQIIFLVNVFYSLFFGPKAGRNPWESNSLEWETVSPPPHGNFENTPIVLRGPYEYGVAEAPGGRISQTGIVQTEGLPTIPQGSQA